MPILAPMARPRAFDIEEALDQAQAVFWDRGYSATTTAELAAAMGIQKGSLFHAFGDKRSLFVQTLTRYLERRMRTLTEALDQSNEPLEAMQSFVVQKAMHCASPQGRLGCFGVNSSVGLAARDPELALLMADYWNQVQQLFTDALARAQVNQAIRKDQDPGNLAHLIMVHLAGMNVIARQGLATDQLQHSVRALFDSFRSAGAASSESTMTAQGGGN